MAKVFLDANVFIDLVENRGEILSDDLGGHEIFISPLSPHILMYVTKRKVPYEKLKNITKLFFIVKLDQPICYQSLEGPTYDFEDNVQLHSAASAQCDIFLTSDKELLKLKFFGKTKITQELIN